MFEFTAKVYEVLAADATLVAMLSTVPGAPVVRPAIYVNHLSHFKDVTYPAVSLCWESSGADQAVQCAEGGVFIVDVWTEEAATAPRVSQLSGAWTAYRRIKGALHCAHKGRRLASAAYKLTYCVEMDAVALDDFDRSQKLYHLSAPYRVRLLPAGAELAYPT